MQRNPGKTKKFAVLLVRRLSMAQTKWMIPASQTGQRKLLWVWMWLSHTVTTYLQRYFPTWFCCQGTSIVNVHRLDHQHLFAKAEGLATSLNGFQHSLPCCWAAREAVGWLPCWMPPCSGWMLPCGGCMRPCTTHQANSMQHPSKSTFSASVPRQWQNGILGGSPGNRIVSGMDPRS